MLRNWWFLNTRNAWKKLGQVNGSNSISFSNLPQNISTVKIMAFIDNVPCEVHNKDFPIDFINSIASRWYSYGVLSDKYQCRIDITKNSCAISVMEWNTTNVISTSHMEVYYK